MIFVAGSCGRCGKYYELPLQENEASAYLQVQDGQLILTILCVNEPLCKERTEQTARLLAPAPRPDEYSSLMNSCRFIGLVDA